MASVVAYFGPSVNWEFIMHAPNRKKSFLNNRGGAKSPQDLFPRMKNCVFSPAPEASI
jgi:hypothetical protein